MSVQMSIKTSIRLGNKVDGQESVSFNGDKSLERIRNAFHINSQRVNLCCS